MDKVAAINELKNKKEEAQTLLTKYRTQLEGIVEQREKITAELSEKFNVTPEEAQSKLDALSQKRDELLEEAQKALSKINIG
jgi:chromosome segregation ATPase